MGRRNGQTGYTAFFQMQSVRLHPSTDCYPNYRSLELVLQHRHVVFKLLAVSNQLICLSWFKHFYVRRAIVARWLALSRGNLYLALRSLYQKCVRVFCCCLGVPVLFEENGVDSGRLWSPHGPNFEFPGCQKGSERLACRFKCASEWIPAFSCWENWLLDLDSERFSKVWWIFQRMNMMMIVPA